MKKYFIIALATFSLLFGSVNAEENDFYLNDFKLNNYSFSSNDFLYFKSGNQRFSFGLVPYNFQAQQNLYVSIVVCADVDFSGGFGDSGISNINTINTSKSCKFPNSGYSGGRIKILNFNLKTGVGNEFSGGFSVYAPAGFSVSLIKFNLSASNFISINDLPADIDLTDTNNKLDKTNDTLTSEDDDVTSKKCGVVCKLKGIFTGIIELPSKIVNGLIDALKSLFVPTDEQLYEIVNKSKDLSENFGFVGESVNFFIDIFTSLLGMVNANGCIELPAFKMGTTSLFDEHTFWEARQTCLADNVILSANIDTIRTITSIVFVSLFLGFASRKFFSILSKESNNNDVTDSMSNTKWI